MLSYLSLTFGSLLYFWIAYMVWYELCTTHLWGIRAGETTAQKFWRHLRYHLPGGSALRLAHLRKMMANTASEAEMRENEDYGLKVFGKNLDFFFCFVVAPLFWPAPACLSLVCDGLSALGLWNEEKEKK